MFVSTLVYAEVVVGKVVVFDREDEIKFDVSEGLVVGEEATYKMMLVDEWEFSFVDGFVREHLEFVVEVVIEAMR